MLLPTIEILSHLLSDVIGLMSWCIYLYTSFPSPLSHTHIRTHIHRHTLVFFLQFFRYATENCQSNWVMGSALHLLVDQNRITTQAVASLREVAKEARLNSPTENNAVNQYSGTEM